MIVGDVAPTDLFNIIYIYPTTITGVRYKKEICETHISFSI